MTSLLQTRVLSNPSFVLYMQVVDLGFCLEVGAAVTLQNLQLLCQKQVATK